VVLIATSISRRLVLERQRSYDMETLGAGVVLFRCLDAVCEGLEAEKTVEQMAHQSLTALGGILVSVDGMGPSSRCTEYQTSFPFTAWADMVKRPWYRLCSSHAATSSNSPCSQSSALAPLVPCLVSLGRRPRLQLWLHCTRSPPPSH
jgi:hypothetical protein